MYMSLAIAFQQLSPVLHIFIFINAFILLTNVINIAEICSKHKIEDVIEQLGKGK